MTISVTDPVTQAYRRTVKLLFTPFELAKWFALGFCAWIAYIGEGGSVPAFNLGGSHGWTPPSQTHAGPLTPADVLQWVRAHVTPIIIIGVLAIVALTALGLLISWIRARGRFIFLEAVVRDSQAVVEPWRRLRRLGNSLFWFNFWVGLAALIILAVIAGIALRIAWSDITARHFGIHSLAAILFWIFPTLVIAIVALVIHLLVKDFVVPIMYATGQKAWPAWRILLVDVLKGHGDILLLFYLLKFALSLLMGGLAALATCLTCCVAALPYIGTVILLPIYVFDRCFSIYMIEQFGEKWRFFTPEQPPELPAQR